MIWILVTAGAVAWIFGNTFDAIAILAIVILNAVIGHSGVGGPPGVVALLFELGLSRKGPLHALTMTSISLAAAAVPGELPAVVTVAISLGRHAHGPPPRLGKALGCGSVICTD